MLHDEDLAQAIIDRVLERGRLLRLDGPSVRTLPVNLDDATKEDSDQDADLVGISGSSRSEISGTHKCLIVSQAPSGVWPRRNPVTGAAMSLSAATRSGPLPAGLLARGAATTVLAGAPHDVTVVSVGFGKQPHIGDLGWKIGEFCQQPEIAKGHQNGRYVPSS